MNGQENNPFAVKFGPKQSSTMPQPNMGQAMSAPKAAPTPGVSTGGFAKPGSKPPMPGLMDE